MEGVKITLQTDYNGIGKIQYIIGSMDINTLDTRYTELVEVDVIVPLSKEKEFNDKITEGTAGRTVIKRGPQVYYIVVDDHCILQ